MRETPQTTSEWAALLWLFVMAYISGLGMMAFLTTPVALVAWLVWNYVIAETVNSLESMTFSQAWLLTWVVACVLDKSWRATANQVAFKRFSMLKKDLNGQEEGNT